MNFVLVCLIQPNETFLSNCYYRVCRVRLSACLSVRALVSQKTKFNFSMHVALYGHRSVFPQ